MEYLWELLFVGLSDGMAVGALVIRLSVGTPVGVFIVKFNVGITVLGDRVIGFGVGVVLLDLKMASRWENTLTILLPPTTERIHAALYFRSRQG